MESIDAELVQLQCTFRNMTHCIQDIRDIVHQHHRMPQLIFKKMQSNVAQTEQMLGSIYRSIENINNLRARQETDAYQWPCQPAASYRRQWQRQQAASDLRQRQPGTQQLVVALARHREYARRDFARRENTPQKESTDGAYQHALQRASEQEKQRQDSNVMQIDTSAQWDHIMTQSKIKPVVVFFTQKRCGPCIDITPTFNEAAATYTNALFAILDINKAIHIPIPEIQGTPTFFLYNNDKSIETNLKDIIQELRCPGGLCQARKNPV